MQRFGLQDRVIALTGGSGLIGAAWAQALPAYGAQVVVGVRNKNAAREKLAGLDLPEGAAKPDIRTLDVGDSSSVDSFFRSIETDYSRLDGLVNNAWPRTKDWITPFLEYSPDSLMKNLCDHAGGFFLCCQAAARVMIPRERGVIVNLGSIYGQDGPRFPIYQDTDMTCPGPYPLIKGGVHTFTRYLATLLAEHNIRVNALAPGGVADPARQHDDFRARYEANTPLGRMATPDDLVGPLVFLLSDASAYVTGQILFADGGWTAW